MELNGALDGPVAKKAAKFVHAGKKPPCIRDEERPTLWLLYKLTCQHLVIFLSPKKWLRLRVTVEV